jgi:hypothetical protein
MRQIIYVTYVQKIVTLVSIIPTFILMIISHVQIVFLLISSSIQHSVLVTISLNATHPLTIIQSIILVTFALKIAAYASLIIMNQSL